MKGVSYDHNQILENKFEKSDITFYLKNLGLPILIQLIMMGFLVFCMVIGRINVLKGILYLVVLTSFVVLMIGYLLYKRMTVNKGMKEDIDHIGKDNVLVDLNDFNNDVFFLHPDRYDTYIVISSRNVYFSRVAIYPINEIKKIYIDFDDMSYQMRAGGNTNKPFDPNNLSAGNVLRFCKPVYVTKTDGKTERRLIALSPEDMATVDGIFRTLGTEAWIGL